MREVAVGFVKTAQMMVLDVDYVLKYMSKKEVSKATFGVWNLE